jgi:hypothetical protein
MIDLFYISILVLLVAGTCVALALVSHSLKGSKD